MSERCSAVDAWIRDQGGAAHEEPPEDLSAHVAGCPRCRGVLLALLGDLAGPRQAVADITCAVAERQLPDLVDYERVEGLGAGLRSFPSVWWHTVLCRRCDQQYRWLQQLAAQPARPWVPRRAVEPAATSTVIRIATSMIRQMLGATMQLGQSWGGELSDMVIADEQEDIGGVEVLLRRDGTGEITLVVRVQPPLAGVATVALAGRRLQAPLDADGCAQFYGLPEGLFTAEASGELTISVASAAAR